MKSLPRLLPLIAVAIGGVLAVKALSGVQALPDLMSAASAHAEAPGAAGHATSAKGPAKAAPTPAPVAQTVAAPKPPPACMTSPAELAREAGLSAGELQTLQNLQTRRGQLDDREKALDTQLQLLAAAEAKVDAKIKAMNTVKGQIQALLGQADQQQQADVDRLTSVYQKMKPADAAAVMATLDDKVRVPVAAKMKDAALAAILGKMPTNEAKKLTESLAQRAAQAKASVQAAEQAANAPVVTAAATPDPTESAPEAKAKPHARRDATAKRKTPHEAAAVQAKPAVAVTSTPLVKSAAAVVPTASKDVKPAPAGSAAPATAAPVAAAKPKVG